MARRNENSSSRDAIRARNRVLLRSTKNVQHKKADLSSNTVTVLWKLRIEDINGKCHIVKAHLSDLEGLIDWLNDGKGKTEQ